MSGEFTPTIIRNRDIPTLTEVLCIMQEIQMLEKQRGWQRENLFSMAQRLTGMPGGGGLPKGLDDPFARLAELDEEQKRRAGEYEKQLRAAEEILNTIPAQSLRTFVKMKYVMNAPDSEIRKELNMTRRGFDRARKCVEDAPDMVSVRWSEKYVVAKKGYGAK